MIKAVIFDMDGVMIDSEPFWQETEREVFAQLGLQLSQSDLESTMGMRIDAVVQHWFVKSPWNKEATPLKSIENQIIKGVSQRIKSHGKPLAGLFQALKLIEQQGLLIGLATSSDQPIIDAVLDSFGIKDRFLACISARQEKAGKPAPDVYITTARKLGVPPHECLAIEDSATGLRSAMAAGMKTIAIPGPEYPDDLIFSKAEFRLSSLEELSTSMLD
jgi:sugar-phosphatase